MNMSIINPEMDNCNLTGFETEEEMIDNLLKLLDEPTLFAQELNTRHHNALSTNASFPMSPDNNTQDLNAQYSNAYLNALCPILPNNNAHGSDRSVGQFLAALQPYMPSCPML